MNAFVEQVGLCKNCGHARVIKNARGSSFYLCALAEKNPRFPRYPRLPVLTCEGHIGLSESSATQRPKRDE